MVHIGKLYKLQFRRDLNNGGFNVFGWPEAFNVQLGTFGGVLGAALGLRNYQLVNTLKNSQPPMIWTGGPFLIGGRHYTVTLTISGMPPSQTTTSRVVINDSILGNVIIADFPQPGLLGQPASYVASAQVPITHLSAGYTVIGPQVTMDAQAATWATYNP